MCKNGPCCIVWVGQKEALRQWKHGEMLHDTHTGGAGRMKATGRGCREYFVEEKKQAAKDHILRRKGRSVQTRAYVHTRVQSYGPLSVH